METEEGGAAWRRWGRSERYSKQWTGYRAQEKGQVDLDKEMSKKKKKKKKKKKIEKVVPQVWKPKGR